MRFDGYQPDRFFDEMFIAANRPREGAKLLVQKLESLEGEELIERHAPGFRDSILPRAGASRVSQPADNKHAGEDHPRRWCCD